MIPAPPWKMNVHRLEVANFRRFSQLTCTLEQDLTVFVAENGGGKTAILDALAVGLRPIVDEIRGVPVRGFSPTDLRLIPTSNGAMVEVGVTSVALEATLSGLSLRWERQLKSRHGRTSSAGLAKEWAKSTRMTMADAAAQGTLQPFLPVVAYYGTGRLWRTHNDTKEKSKAARDGALQTNAYIDALSPSSSYHQFEVWFEKIVREAQKESVTGVISPHRPELSKSAVVSAVNTILAPTGWRGLDWDFVLEEVVARHERYGRLSVSALSDGIRNLLALVADLAHRAVRLNPHLGDGACKESPGIVLIDEVDMHLHPSWQQQVLPLLRDAFPRMQFIVTTHSPLVLSTVPARCIRELTDDEQDPVRGVVSETQGYSATFALASVFKVDSDPPGEMADTLRQVRRDIEDGHAEAPATMAMKATLLKHFGAGHPAMVSLRSFERLCALKQKQKA